MRQNRDTPEASLHEAATAGPIEPADWRTFGLVGAVIMVTQLGFYLTAAALPLYLHDLGAAEGRIGLEVGLGNVTALAVTLVLGPALNRYGSRVFLSTGATIYLVAAVGMLTLADEAAVAGFRALQGIGNAIIIIANCITMSIHHCFCSRSFSRLHRRCAGFNTPADFSGFSAR